MPTNSPHPTPVDDRAQRGDTRARRIRRDAAGRAVERQLFVTGGLAGLLTATAMLVIRRLTGQESLVELIAESLLQLMPVFVFEFFLRLLQGLAKPLLLVGVVVGFVLTLAGLARIDRGPTQAIRGRRRLGRIAGLTAGIWIPTTLFALVATSVFNGVRLSNGGLIQLIFVLLGLAVVYAVALYALFPLVSLALSRSSTRVDVPPADLGRRRFIAQASLAAIALAATSYLGRFARGVTGGTAGGGNAIPDPITPNARFYRISKNFVDPSVDEETWTLSVTGFVATPLKLSYVEVLGLASVEQMTTLTCISNEVGGDLISNAVWTGVRLTDLLARAGVRPEASELVLYARDGYTESLPLSKALEQTTLLAWLMNGESLPERHGYPARLVVPGKYGIKNVKWLTKIELTAGDFKGYWQQRGWTDEATIKTLSRFDIPGSRVIVPLGPVELGGVAFAGDRGISRVEVSADGGATWGDVDQLQTIGPLAWAIWRSTWNPPALGAYALRVRATDGTGAVQSAEDMKPIPTGASGYHVIEIGVT